MSETQRWSPDVPEATIAIAGQKLTAGQVAPLFLTKDASPPVTYSGLGKTLKELCGSGQPLWLNVEQWRSIVGFVTGSECYRKQLARYRSRHPFPILEGLQGLLGMLPDNTAPQDFALDLDPLPVAGHSYLCDLSEGYFEAAIDGEKRYWLMARSWPKPARKVGNSETPSCWRWRRVATRMVTELSPGFYIRRSTTKASNQLKGP